MQGGWVKLHRKLLNKPLWAESTPEQKTILITLLMMVNYESNEWEWQGEKYTVQPGEMITSLESIAQASGKGVSVQNVRTALRRFEKYGFLTNKSTNKNRLITIDNWGLYQQQNDTPNKQINSQLTSSQQAPNNYKEVKKLKNHKKNTSSDPRDKEIAFQKWISDGNNPEDYKWN
jgi:DNA replication protein DnaD